MKKTIVAALVLAVLMPPHAIAAPGEEDPLAERIKAHTVFLAHDLLEGRDTGSRGYDIAAQYVVSAFSQSGLTPMGTDGYLQPVPLRRRSLVDVDLHITMPGTTLPLVNGEDVAIDGSPLHVRESLKLPLVFVGWGITAPALGLDDYAGLDVAGKAVVLIEGAPPSLPGALRAHYSWIQQKERMAAERGARAVLTIKSPERERFSPWDMTRQFRPLPAVHWYATGDQRPPAVDATVSLSPQLAARLFAENGIDLARLYQEAARRPPAPRDLNAEILISRHSRHEDIVSSNVVGMIEGSDPSVSDEYVVVLAHLDHVGIGKPVNGDAIYNGAVDNAGGVAVMLEAARLLKQKGTRRPILFIATTGEEKGLIGADFFATYPTVPREKIVAAISVDGLMAWHDFEDIVALGAEHSTLGDASRRAARAIGARHVPDPIPERGNLALSDQYPFLRFGIPVLFPNPGPRDPATGLFEHPNWSAYEATSYHKPSDQTDLPLRWDVAARWARYIELTISEIADGSRPTWYEGDVLADGFAPEGPREPRPQQ